MTYLKRAAIVAMVCLAASGLYMKYEPELVYLAGQFSAGLERPGRVSGEAVHRLTVPFHRQERALSCELASLKMALAGVGVDVPEIDLVSRVNFDPTVRSGGIWGDPYTGFVGDIDGRMGSTGYGVYWDPVAKVGLHYANTKVLHNSSLPELLYHLNQGHPVVVWGYFGRGQQMNWTTPAGRPIAAINGEHARVLVGYTGSSVHPDSLLLIDPIYGELEWSVDEFLANWGALESAGIVVYDSPRWAVTPGDDTVWVIDPDANTRQALAMDWDGFLAHGGIPEGIKTVSPGWLESLAIGPALH